VKLHVVDDELASCVSCGLCLPHCPTYRVSGEEAASPRGRIAVIRLLHWEDAPPDDEAVGFLDACVQCRACETACPSGVPYGRLIEGAKETLAAAGRITPRWQRLAYRGLGHHRLLVAGSRALALAQRLRLVPRRLGLPRLPLRAAPLRPGPARPGAAPVWLFTGCVMDAWQRDVHAAVLRVLEAAGAAVSLPGVGAACCGALHVHAGLADPARALAARVMGAMPGEAPVLVDSAGCGAALKDYGRLIGTDEARAFSARVLDVHEWLATRMDLLPAAADRTRVVVQDPCHLRHVQKAHLPVRTVLGHVAEVVELDDDGLCCGAGGAYSALHPDTAAAVRDRKLAAIARAGGGTVASANPGCQLHLAAAGVDAVHPLVLVDRALWSRSARERSVPSRSRLERARSIPYT
jgi:glycolate oxidase iron-sulfur subunit